ncbi:hypothetical protein [Mesorhizobium sp. f-mel]
MPPIDVETNGVEVAAFNSTRGRPIHTPKARCLPVRAYSRCFALQLANVTLERMAEFVENTTAFDEGHNEGLRGFLDSGGHCPDSIRPAHWHVVPSDERNFVLGDAGTFAVTSSGSICPLIGISSDWYEVYLPISPSMTVVGTRHSDRPKLDVTEIVTGSISTSYEEFYAEVYSQHLEERASKEINTANELISSTALRAFRI